MSVVTGTRRAFAASAGTTSPDRVWQLWTDVSSWGAWDRGLRSASIDGPFEPGTRGRLVDTGGRTSVFVVEHVEVGRSCQVRVRLPSAGLVLRRSMQPSAAQGGVTTVTHEVGFEGALAPLFALLLGGRFRRLLSPTMDALVQLAEGPRR